MIVVKRKLVIYKGAYRAHHSTSLERARINNERVLSRAAGWATLYVPMASVCFGRKDVDSRCIHAVEQTVRGMARAQLQPSYADRQIRERGCRLRIETVCLLTRGSKTSFASALSLGSSTRGT